MKLSHRQINPFVKSPDPAARVILLYGPERGLLDERVETIGKTICPDLNDPFNVIKLNAQQILDDPARLSDEANAISMMGGARLIIIQDAANSLTTILNEYLKAPSPENLVIVIAGDLDARSSLRKAIEKAKNAAALPCYIEDQRDLAGLIRERLGEAGINPDRDAVTYLSQSLSGNRGFLYAELEKLALYLGAYSPDFQKPYTLNVDEARFIINDGGHVDFDDLIYAMCDGKKDNALQHFDQLIAEGVQTIAIQRAMQRHFRRLLITKERILSGENAVKASKMLKPPLFFKVQDRFFSQVQKWSKPRMVAAIQKLNETESKCKQTGYSDITLTAQMILALSR